MNELLKKDYLRYNNEKMPKFQIYYRKAFCAKNPFSKVLYKTLLKFYRSLNNIDLASTCKIGGGLYIGHPYCITINPQTIIGKNVNIHKGVTIGQENRGARKGVPHIGNNVWIGINATIVGNIRIGNDVLIAPNSYVNCDVPDHSIVLGNPCIIKHKSNATEDYICRTV